MKFLSFREFRNNPTQVRRLLREEDLVLTASGKPVGVLVAVGDDDLDETFRLLRRARAQAAVSRMRTAAARTGLQGQSMAEIDRGIRVVRDAGRRKRSRQRHGI